MKKLIVLFTLFSGLCFAQRQLNGLPTSCTPLSSLGFVFGGVDESALFNTTLTNVFNQGGGCIYIDCGKTLTTHPASFISIPLATNTQTDVVGTMPGFRITGCGSTGSLYTDHVYSIGGSVWDLGGGSSNVYLASFGRGILEIDHLTITNLTPDAGKRFFQMTGTTLFFHDNTLLGPLNFTSTTSVTPGTGSKAFTTVQACSSLTISGTPGVVVQSRANAANYMLGTFVSCSGSTLTISVAAGQFAGVAAADWDVRIPGAATNNGIYLGGTGASGCSGGITGALTDDFQGYSPIIRNNYFLNLLESVFGEPCHVNGPVVLDNMFRGGSTASPSAAHIESQGFGTGGSSNNGWKIIGNLFEMCSTSTSCAEVQCGVKFTHTETSTITSNTAYDGSSSSGLVCLKSDATGIDVRGNQVDTSGVTLVNTLSGTFIPDKTVHFAGVSAFTGSIGGGALAAGACTTGTASLTGAAAGMAVAATPAADPQVDATHAVYWVAWVSSANTVTVRVCAVLATTPNATTYTVVLQ